MNVVGLKTWRLILRVVRHDNGRILFCKEQDHLLGDVHTSRAWLQEAMAWIAPSIAGKNRDGSGWLVDDVANRMLGRNFWRFTPPPTETVAKDMERDGKSNWVSLQCRPSRTEFEIIDANGPNGNLKNWVRADNDVTFSVGSLDLIILSYHVTFAEWLKSIGSCFVAMRLFNWRLFHFQRQLTCMCPIILTVLKGIAWSLQCSKLQPCLSAIATGSSTNGYPRTRSLSFQWQPWRWFNACTRQLGATKGGEEGGFCSIEQ